MDAARPKISHRDAITKLPEGFDPSTLEERDDGSGSDTDDMQVRGGASTAAAAHVQAAEAAVAESRPETPPAAAAVAAAAVEAPPVEAAPAVTQVTEGPSAAAVAHLESREASGERQSRFKLSEFTSRVRSKSPRPGKPGRLNTFAGPSVDASALSPQASPHSLESAPTSPRTPKSPGSMQTPTNLTPSNASPSSFIKKLSAVGTAAFTKRPTEWKPVTLEGPVETEFLQGPKSASSVASSENQYFNLGKNPAVRFLELAKAFAEATEGMQEVDVFESAGRKKEQVFQSADVRRGELFKQLYREVLDPALPWPLMTSTPALDALRAKCSPEVIGKLLSIGADSETAALMRAACGELKVALNPANFDSVASVRANPAALMMFQAFQARIGGAENLVAYNKAKAILDLPSKQEQATAFLALCEEVASGDFNQSDLQGTVFTNAKAEAQRIANGEPPAESSILVQGINKVSGAFFRVLDGNLRTFRSDLAKDINAAQQNRTID